MCEATTMAVIAIAQAGLSIYTAQQQADAAEKAQKRQTEAENERFLQAERAARARETQEAIATAQQVQEIELKSLQAKESGSLAAMEAGLDTASNSVQALLMDYARQEGKAKFATQQQSEFRGVASYLAEQDRTLASQQRLINIAQPIQQPDYLGAALNLAGQGMSIYRQSEQDKYNDELLRLKKIEVGG